MINKNFNILPGYRSIMTDIRELLANNIKKFRKIRGFSQETLAEKAFTSTTHIGMIEIGKKFPSPKMLEQIAEALGVDTPELFTTEAVFFISSNNKSIESLYQDIVNDFRLFEKSVTKKILDLNLKET
jgi:transcriptional regulator with XRE-family HTH domain